MRSLLDVLHCSVLPLGDLDEAALFKVTLDAKHDVVERAVREVFLEDVVDFGASDLAILETH